jgi:hypothetical protein
MGREKKEGGEKLKSRESLLESRRKGRLGMWEKINLGLKKGHCRDKERREMGLGR